MCVYCAYKNHHNGDEYEQNKQEKMKVVFDSEAVKNGSISVYLAIVIKYWLNSAMT